MHTTRVECENAGTGRHDMYLRSQPSCTRAVAVEVATLFHSSKYIQYVLLRSTAWTQ